MQDRLEAGRGGIKLCDRDVVTVFGMRLLGIPPYRISYAFRVSRGAINGILRGKTQIDAADRELERYALGASEPVLQAA
jgi:hypothetical protein